MDTNMVLPTGPGSCTVVYDYYLDTAEIGRLGDQVRGHSCTLHNMYTVSSSASKSSIRRFVITEKAPTRAFSWLKEAY